MRFSTLLLQAVVAFAAPNPYPAQAEPALAVRAEDAAAATSSLTVANTFTDLASSSVNPGGIIQNATTSAATAVQTGEFTAADGGIYGVTIQSGYAVVDGHTLAPGQSALIGNEIVSEGSSGFVANGQTLVLSTVSAMSTASSTTTTGAAASAGSSSSGMSSATGSSTHSGSTTSGTGSAAAASSASSTSSKAAAPAMVTSNGVLAAAGGLLALMAL